MKNNESRRGKVTDEHRQEAQLLKVIWEKTYEERKARGLHTQGAFGAEYDIGGQAVVGFFLNGHTALSLKAARGFAKGLDCQISDFSPRLAALESSWPFELVDRERYEALPPALRFKAQVRMQDEIEALEQALKANGMHN
jgi:hypothetical protein